MATANFLAKPLNDITQDLELQVGPKFIAEKHCLVAQALG